jgi:hypothetical protein
MTSLGRRSAMVRACWLAAALLQLVVPGTAAWADARLDAAGTHARPHVESHSTTTCVRVHPADCTLCRFLTSPLGMARPPLVCLDAPDRHAPPAFARIAEPVSPLGRLPHSRAPPALS